MNRENLSKTTTKDVKNPYRNEENVKIVKKQKKSSQIASINTSKIDNVGNKKTVWSRQRSKKFGKNI